MLSNGKHAHKSLTTSCQGEAWVDEPSSGFKTSVPPTFREGASRFQSARLFRSHNMHTLTCTPKIKQISRAKLIAQKKGLLRSKMIVI